LHYFIYHLFSTAVFVPGLSLRPLVFLFRDRFSNGLRQRLGFYSRELVRQKLSAARDKGYQVAAEDPAVLNQSIALAQRYLPPETHAQPVLPFAPMN
jgi:hypothetical protein